MEQTQKDIETRIDDDKSILNYLYGELSFLWDIYHEEKNVIERYELLVKIRYFESLIEIQNANIKDLQKKLVKQKD